MALCVQTWKQGNSICIDHLFHMRACTPNACKLTLIAFQCGTHYLWDISASLQLAGIIRPHDGNCYIPRLVDSEPDTRYTMWGVFVSRCFYIIIIPGRYMLLAVSTHTSPGFCSKWYHQFYVVCCHRKFLCVTQQHYSQTVTWIRLPTYPTVIL